MNKSLLELLEEKKEVENSGFVILRLLSLLIIQRTKKKDIMKKPAIRLLKVMK